MIRAWIALVVVVCAATARADDTVARDAFRRAQDAANANPPRWAEACPLFEASYRADPQIGVLLYLADCYEHVGRFASAWTAFNDAAELARARKDTRETIAKSRADALVTKLSKLVITAPPSIIPGLKVMRDGVDVTVLVGREMVVDPGMREIVATAPGHVTWTQQVTIPGPGVTELQLPSLEKAPEPKVVERRGTLVITSQPDAEIYLDQQRVGTASYTGTLKIGGHTLRVVAPHKRPYQTEVVVGEGTRTIEVALEVESPVEERLPSFELAAGLAPGVKLRGDNPVVLALRLEAALRLVRRINLGVYAEYARIDTSGACGTAISGPEPTTPFDIGPRHRFTSCSYFAAGLQLYIHVMPKRRIDPYIGIAPGIRSGTADFETRFADAMASTGSVETLELVTAVRAGVTYHVPDRRWTFGGYLEGSFMIAGDEETIEDGARFGGPSADYLTILAGARSTVQF